MKDDVPQDPTPEPLEELLRDHSAWLMLQCERTARSWPGILDAQDLYQEVVLRLLRSRVDIYSTAGGLRTMLARTVRWTAHDLVWTASRMPSHVSLEELNDWEGAITTASSTEESLLRELGLTDNQVIALGRDLEYPELTFEQYAELTGRSYAAMRKDRERAVIRLVAWLGLDPVEHPEMPPSLLLKQLRSRIHARELFVWATESIKVPSAGGYAAPTRPQTDKSYGQAISAATQDLNWALNEIGPPPTPADSGARGLPPETPTGGASS